MSPKSAFASADADGSSCLTLGEIMDQAENADLNLDFEQSRTAFEEADADRNGCIDWEEAMAWNNQQQNRKKRVIFTVDVEPHQGGLRSFRFNINKKTGAFQAQSGPDNSNSFQFQQSGPLKEGRSIMFQGNPEMVEPEPIPIQESTAKEAKAPRSNSFRFRSGPARKRSNRLKGNHRMVEPEPYTIEESDPNIIQFSLSSKEGSNLLDSLMAGVLTPSYSPSQDGPSQDGQSSYNANQNWLANQFGL